MSFCCVAKGSVHQGNEKLCPTSKNSQCTAISACALAWKTLRLEFSTAAIDRILITGDSIYNTLRSDNRMGGIRYLCPDELPTDFLIHVQSVSVEENSFVHDALYPLTVGDMGDCILSLSNVLEGLIAENFENTGFLFTGQTVTVAFWRSHEQPHLFDPHPVNEERIYDLANHGRPKRLASTRDDTLRATETPYAVTDNVILRSTGTLSFVTTNNILRSTGRPFIGMIRLNNPKLANFITYLSHLLDSSLLTDQCHIGAVYYSTT
ncbi:hypothetical protein J6590_107824 [Homalodisca vitripennis]|nr:hypothetical protein J6590_107824 [Homalodisca vitripennis]